MSTFAQFLRKDACFLFLDVLIQDERNYEKYSVA